MTRNKSTTTGDKRCIRSNYEYIKPLAFVEQPIDKHEFDMARGEWEKAIERLRDASAIETVGKKTVSRMDDRRTDRINVYRVKEWAREYIQTIEEHQSTLPCGHQAHIYNVDGRLDCKYCDEQRNFSKAVVKEAMNG